MNALNGPLRETVADLPATDPDLTALPGAAAGGRAERKVRSAIEEIVGLRRHVPDAVDVPATERGRLRVRLRHTLIRQLSRSLVLCDRALGDRVGEGFGVLMYHRCCPAEPAAEPPSLNVTPEALRGQLSGLLERGFVFRPLPEVLGDVEAGRPVPRGTVVVTFDDGFACLAGHAMPVLEELRVPASVFVCTGLIDREEPMPFDPWGGRMAGRVDPACYRSLNAREVRGMLDSGLIDIGAHTHGHDDFRGRPRDLREDLGRCARTLAARFDVRNPTFAFPFGTPSLGFADDALAGAARAAGMRCALTSESRIVRPSDDPFAWGRLNVFEWDTAATLQARLHGWYSWMPRLWAGVRRRRRGGAGR